MIYINAEELTTLRKRCTATDEHVWKDFWDWVSKIDLFEVKDDAAVWLIKIWVNSSILFIPCLLWSPGLDHPAYYELKPKFWWEVDVLLNMTFNFHIY